MALEHYDVIIIGQGLAGSLLAWRCHTRNKKVLIIDKGRGTNASGVAAGIINPVTGPRVVKQANADAYLLSAGNLYRNLESKFNTSLYCDRSFRRIFQTDEELDYWLRRCHDPDYDNFLKCQNHDSNESNSVNLFKDPMGSGMHANVMQLDTPKTLQMLKTYFQQQHAYIQESIDYEDVELLEVGVRIGAIEADHLVFCDGYAVINNPWFKHLPIKPAKGDILSFETNMNLGSQIQSFGRWFLPVDNHVFKFGANYEWHNYDETPSVMAKKQLIKEFSRALKSRFQREFPFQLKNHQSGIRACTGDRNALIGTHPEYRQLSLFNGFGTKGCLTIPRLSENFCSHLFENTPLDSENSINRLSR